MTIGVNARKIIVESQTGNLFVKKVYNNLVIKQLSDKLRWSMKFTG